MSLYQEHADGLDELHAEYGEDSLVFSWNGKEDWAILPGGARFRRDNSPGGFTLTSDLQLTCTTAQFGGTLPDSGESMSYAGKDYTIDFITPAAAGCQLRINATLNATGL